MKPEDKAVVQQVRKYLVPGAIVPVDVPTTQLLLRALRQLLEQPAVWVGLTEAERRVINYQWRDGNGTSTEIMDLVEAKLREKNGGAA